jgi:rhamnosyltransferase
MSKSLDKYITVFVPTFNGEAHLSELIEAVLKQELPKSYELELLIIDSGSTDKTLVIIETYKDQVRLVEIPNKEFSHGGTRGKAAHLAKGEFVLYLTQDATPTNDRWLINMIEPFFLSDQIGCVFGRQIPRPNAAVTIKREVATVFTSFGPSNAILVHRNKSIVDNSNKVTAHPFFSDVNSAVRRHLVTGPVPFRNVHYAEDQALAEDMQQGGYLKAYAPEGAVWHSNEYTARQYYQRKFDEYIGLQESIGTHFKPSKKSLLLGWVRPTLADYRFIWHDHEYGPRSKLKWLVLSPFYNIGNQAGKYYAGKHLHNNKKRQKISLETKLRG